MTGGRGAISVYVCAVVAEHPSFITVKRCIAAQVTKEEKAKRLFALGLSSLSCHQSSEM